MTANNKQAVIDDTVSQQDTAIADPIANVIDKYTINGIKPINANEIEHTLNTSKQNGTANTEKQHLWKPGQSGNPSGRTKGSKNRKQLESQFYADLAADWNDHGIQAVVDLRETNPVKYVQLVASVMPKSIEVDDSGGIAWVINAKPVTTDQWLANHNLLSNQHDTDIIE